MARNLIDLCNKLKETRPAISTLQKVMRTLAPGIKTSVRTNVPGGGNLMQLTVQFGNKITTELARQCHGVVIDCDTWQILSMLTPQFNANYKKADLLKNFAHYTFQKAMDGSLLSVYWNNGLKISSSNGYDVSQMRRFGETTYLLALCELLQMTPEAATDYFFPSAEFHRKCYVICLRHHNFQLLEKDPPCLILIASFDLDTTMEIPCDLNLPRHETIEINTATPEVSFARLVKMCNDAYKSFTITGECVYGIIMRSKTLPVEYVSCSDILIESSLMRVVRKYIYDVKCTTKTPILPKAPTPAQLCLFVSLRAFLEGKGDEFGRLFPALPLTEYHKLTGDLTLAIMDIITGHPVAERGKGFMSIAQAVAHHLAPLVKGKCPDLASVIQNQLVNVGMMGVYYTYWMSAATSS
jgi:hypothetical protein